MYKDIVVTKPWGHEYLAYENDEVGFMVFTFKRRTTNFNALPS
jgi:hypothetical protein